MEKLPLLLLSTSLEIALLSGRLGFLPCQSGIGRSCAARRLPDGCAYHVDEEGSCAWRQFQLRERNALCVIAKCNVSHEQTFGFLPFFYRHVKQRVKRLIVLYNRGNFTE